MREVALLKRRENIMAFCNYCGTQTPDGVKFCASCGKEVAANSAQQQAGTPSAVTGAPQQTDNQDVQDNKTMAILAYIHILVLIPLLSGAYKASHFVKYHTNQGTVLFVTWFIYSIAHRILVPILIFIPIIGWILIPILGLVHLVFVVLSILGIINAANGTMKPLPVIGGFTIVK